MNADQPQFEKYWREKIGNDILDIILKSHTENNTSIVEDIYKTIIKQK